MTSPVGFYERNRVAIWEYTAVASLVVGLVALGAIVASMGTSSHWYYINQDKWNGALPDGTPTYEKISKWDHCSYTWNNYNQIPLTVDPSFGFQIQKACQYGAVVGGVALGPCIAGFVLFAVALCSRQYYKRQEQQEAAKKSTEVAPKANPHENDEATKAKTKARTTALILSGVLIAAFAVGMLIASGNILHAGVPHMQQLIDQGKQDFAPPSYDSTFWDDLQRNWQDRTSDAMNGLVAGGTIGILIGGGLVSLGVLGKAGYGVFSCFKDCRKVVEEENSAVITTRDASDI